ncbi:hypothetical protein HK101_006606, partial [Irineochytrium annulatum]
MDSVLKAAKLTKALATNKNVQNLVVNQAVRTVRTTALAIEAPPPRADISISFHDDNGGSSPKPPVVELEAFKPQVVPREVMRLETESDGQQQPAEEQVPIEFIDSRLQGEDKILSGNVTLNLNQDFENVLEVVVDLSGHLRADGDNLARTWIQGGASKLQLKGEKIGEDIDRLVLRDVVTVWRSPGADEGVPAKLESGRHVLPFTVTVSRLTPATTVSEYFSVTHSLSARLVVDPRKTPSGAVPDTPAPANSNPRQVFESASRPVVVRRVRSDPAQIEPVTSKGSTRDGLISYAVTTSAEVFETQGQVEVIVTLTLADGIESMKNLTAVFKQATRHRITAYDHHEVTRER